METKHLKFPVKNRGSDKASIDTGEMGLRVQKEVLSLCHAFKTVIKSSSETTTVVPYSNMSNGFSVSESSS